MTLRLDSTVVDGPNPLLFLLRDRWSKLVKHNNHFAALGHLLSLQVSLQEVRTMKRFATP
jgi:hypothetical protein